MKTIKLIQGTPEWHAHRATHFNASDAPAMMGVSPHMTRNELMARIKTGISPDVDAATQRRFDQGHRFEALACPLAEKIIGEALYLVTGTNGIYSASFDGLTLMEDVAFEHKQLNDDLRACFDGMEAMPPEYRKTASAGRLLPLMYRVQMEHQAMVSGCKRVLFMASEWDGEDNLIEERHCWYAPDPALRAKIVAGWEQLQADLAVYEPAAQAEPAPVGKKPETLPALRIEVTGQVTASNLAAFKETALAAIRSVKRELTNDQDFADADASVKWCSDVESRLAAAKEHALSQTASIDALFKAIDDISAEARRVRLDLEKLVKARKEQIRAEIVSGAIAKGKAHIDTLNARIGKPLMPTIPADYAGVIKGKRTLDSLQDAVDTELARFKIAANEVADRITLNVRAIEAAEHAHLFPDMQGLTLKQPDDLAAVIAQRVAKYKQDQEDARQRTLRLDEERRQREAAQAAQAAQAAHPPVASHSPVVRQLVAASAVIKLGDINARIAPLSISEDGLAQLGIAPVVTDKDAKLYRESDFARICDALIKVVTNAKHPAAEAA